jgi:ATP-dependent protease ClpP protease subunit
MFDTPYRFHGHHKPVRRSVLNAVPVNAGDGATAVLRLYDPIDSFGGEWGVSAKEFGKALDDLGDAEEIRLHINSPGGMVFEGIAIANQLRAHPAKVTAVVDGLAASAASFIAAVADRTVMGRNSELMIHDAWGLGIGNAGDMRELADRLDHLSDNIASIYQEKAGGSLRIWRDAMLAETWYSADEALKAGLADEIQGRPAVADQPEDAFDLSAFKYQGREKAPEPAPITNEAEPEVDDLFRLRHRMNQRRAS